MYKPNDCQGHPLDVPDPRNRSLWYPGIISDFARIVCKADHENMDFVPRLPVR